MLGRYLIVILVVAGALVTAVAMKSTAPFAWPGNDDAQRIKFSHAYHVGEAGIACEDCHAAKTSAKASDNLRPGHDNCQACHEEQLTDKCGTCHVDPENISAAPAPVREVIFSHQQHLGEKGLECATCHAGLDKTEYAGPANMPSMATCNTCHNDRRATNECEACHTKFTNLIPSDHLVASFAREHKLFTRLGALDVECSTCHDQDFCTDCHGASATVMFGKGARMSDPGPRTSVTGGPDVMMLQMAHPMNYRYTHGIDARSRTADCYSCHSTQQFCVDCHASGDNVSALANVPSWHFGGGFTTINRGTGGGRHAEYARRDLESCVSCHDVQGMDATCVQCHIDPDGIRGNDPKTHPGGFMDGEEGLWHNSQGASCYNCHTDYNAHPGGRPGVGFCGYCHGEREED